MKKPHNHRFKTQFISEGMGSYTFHHHSKHLLFENGDVEQRDLYDVFRLMQRNVKQCKELGVKYRIIQYEEELTDA